MFTDLPRSTLTLTPNSPVFTGETVNLKCVIESYSDWRWRNGLTNDWRYEWYKGRYSVMLQTSERYTVNRDTLTIRGATESDQGQYWCRGQRDGRPNSSQSSSAVSLTVKASPKAVLKVTPDQRVFRGETVTLTCDIQGAGDIQWTYSWFKDGSVIRDITERVYTITSVSDRAEYRCRGERSDSQRSDISAAVTLTVSDSYRAALIVTPDSPVFTGERVILKCVIESYSNWRYEWYKDTDSFTESALSSFFTALPRSTLTVRPDSPVFTGETISLKCVIESYSNWRYEWYKGRDSVMLQTSERYTVNRDTLTIRGVNESDQGQFWCRGHIDGRPVSSYSSSVYLTVTDLKPKPELTSDPAGAALTGNTVTLTCHMNLSPGWDFYWYKYTLNSETKTQTNSYRVKIDSVSDGGQYWCRAGRGKPVYYTQYSDALWVNVRVSPKAVVTVRPDERVFRGETVTLRCDIKWGGDTEWTYRWETQGRNNQYTNSVRRISTQELNIISVEDFHSGKYTCTGQMGTQSSQRSDAVTLIISTSDSGVYWCQSESGEKRHPLNITVYVVSTHFLCCVDGDVILESSVDPVIEGHTLTLHCLHRSTNSPILRADFYKDGSLVQHQTTGEMNITTVSKSHEGFYYCKTERGQSLHSWISVRVSRSGQISVFKILSSLLAACMFLLATVVLLFKCCRARVPSAEDQSQYSVREETST
ncbi:hypothetical protein cypCar_00042762 [Cyprinus carpio]|nr:hypothetical protein cypCar_00042762 [Cyprinus carpio]